MINRLKKITWYSLTVIAVIFGAVFVVSAFEHDGGSAEMILASLLGGACFVGAYKAWRKA